jgi:hypothetical protein
MLQVAWLAQWLAQLGVSVAVTTVRPVKTLKNFRKKGCNLAITALSRLAQN